MNARSVVQVVLAVVVLIALAARFCSETIQPGYVGIRYSKLGSPREIDESNIVVGLVFYNPITTGILTYPLTVQRTIWTQTATEGSPNDDSFTFNTTEGLSVNADVAISIRVKRSSAAQIFTRFRISLEAITNGYIRDIVRNTISSVSSRYNIEDILGPKRGQFQNEINQALQVRLGQEGFSLEALSFTGEFRVPKEVREQIQQKIASYQSALAAQNKVKQATFEAQAAVAQAQGQASANLILAKSLTPALVQYQSLQKWDGHLPQVTGSSTLIQLPLGKAQ